MSSAPSIPGKRGYLPQACETGGDFWGLLTQVSAPGCLLVMMASLGALLVLSAYFVAQGILSRTRRCEKDPKERRPQAVPVYTCGVPLFGPALRFLFAPDKVLRDANSKHKSAFALLLPFKSRLIFITGPQATRWFFNAAGAHGSTSRDHDLDLADAIADLIPPYMFGTKVMDHAPYSKYVAHGLGMHARLRAYVAALGGHVDRRLASWAQADVIDLFRESSRLVMSLMIRLVFGEDVEARFPELGDLYFDFDTLATNPAVMLVPWCVSPLGRRFQHARDQIEAIITTVVTERLAERNGKERKAERMDVLQYLIEARAEQRDPEPLVKVLMIVLFAGHANTVGNLSWTIANVVANDDLKREVCAEVRSPGHPFNRTAAAGGDLVAAGLSTAENRNELSLLEKCMREVNRFYSTLYLVRKVRKACCIEGHSLPKGAIVAVSPLLTHFDEATFEAPNTFNPHRFTKSKLETLIADGTYIAFGRGRHQCPGKRLVHTVLHLIWATLFREYDVKMENETVPGPNYVGAIGAPTPSQVIRLVVRKRSESH
ncbi:cytochrome P450 family 51 [Klebsormidium nitens]|uniref:Cytochrome P450 family 51 n=1 Tax=Klebsormidium nitens TaxID=105231 RepID=A0A1Y1HMM6_KLENI|nr:cytochrome P450 family 51 [Klebsormidium nitens]|eukprot:GAQ78251.1 cytochrome P450 family 51 [Klebsormidium nitens]